MIEERFWNIIDTSRETSTDCESQCSELQRILSELPAQDILEFDRIFREKLIEAYRWDLWGVAYLINGGCSDDGFDYFCCWLIGQGRQVFETVLSDPQRILSCLEGDEEDVECEGLLYASHYAYEEVAGEEMPTIGMSRPLEPLGEPWEEEDLERRFPQVAARYF